MKKENITDVTPEGHCARDSKINQSCLNVYVVIFFKWQEIVFKQKVTIENKPGAIDWEATVLK